MHICDIYLGYCYFVGVYAAEVKKTLKFDIAFNSLSASDDFCHLLIIFATVWFVCVHALYPSHQFFSHVVMISCLPELNQY